MGVLARNTAGEMKTIHSAFVPGPKAVDATAGARTWAAASVLGGLLVRTPGGVATDLLDTPANIVAAMDNPQIGDSFFFIVVNLTASVITLGVTANVTQAGTVNIAASAIRMYHVQITALGATPTLTITGVGAMTA